MSNWLQWEQMTFALGFDNDKLSLKEKATFLNSGLKTLGGEGKVLNKILYREAPPRGPTPYPFLYMLIFDKKGTPFAYL